MDLLVSRLRGRVLWTFELVNTLIILGLMILLTWGSWAHFDRAFDWNAPLFSRDSTIDIGLPIWPAKILVPIGFGLISVRLFFQALGFGKALIFDETAPSAVPLVVDVAAQAAAEANAVGSREQ